jgi:hypothetical protein
MVFMVFMVFLVSGVIHRRSWAHVHVNFCKPPGTTRMLTYQALLFIGGSVVVVVVVYSILLNYLLRRDTFTEAAPSLSDNLLPSDEEAQ